MRWLLAGAAADGCDGVVMNRPLATFEEMNARYAADEKRGILLRRETFGSSLVGTQPKKRDKDGYLTLVFKGRQYFVHRVLWLLHKGTWPLAQIDHINGIRTDNRIANLRDVSRKTNLQNRRCRTQGRMDLPLGVVEDGPKRYRASVASNGAQLHVGTFATPQEAHAAYVQAKRKYHEGCTL